MEIISFLPQEIVMDIFNRLPAKSVGRGRCVSKSWRALLSLPCFTKTKCLQQSLILLSGAGSLFTVPLTLRHDEIVEPVKKLSFAGHPDSWDCILGVCDGLVLLENKRGNVFVANPVTREIRQVPPLPFRPNIHDCYNKYGVGYDSVNDDYKIVILSYYAPCMAPDSEDSYDEDGNDIYGKLFVNVFSIKNGIWNAAKSSPYCHGHTDSSIPGVFVDGYIHWIAEDDDDFIIAAFDVVTETFTSVPSPNSSAVSTWSNLMELGGDLCLYTRTDIWIMKEYGNKDSWIQVNLDVDQGTDVRPLCLLGEEQMMLVKDEKRYRETKFVKYNLEKEIFKDIVIHGSSDGFEVQGTFIETCHPYGPFFCRTTFIQSLVSPHSGHTTS